MSFPGTIRKLLSLTVCVVQVEFKAEKTPDGIFIIEPDTALQESVLHLEEGLIEPMSNDSQVLYITNQTGFIQESTDTWLPNCI